MDESGSSSLTYTRTKRKKTVISLEKKLEAINRMFRGESIHSIARSYGVGVSTAWDWKRNRQRLQEWHRKTIHNTLANSRSGADFRKTMKPSEYDVVDSALYTWYLEQRRLGNDILTGVMLQQKAISINAELYGHEGTNNDNSSRKDRMAERRAKFSASTGWLNRWKKRHGIGKCTDSNVKNDNDSNNLCINENKEEFGEENPLATSDEEQKMSIFEIPQPITNLIKTLVTEENYNFDEIYCCRQMSLNFNEMPENTVIRPPDRRYRNVARKFTVFIGSNYSGTHKLPAMCIGKPAKPAVTKLEAWCIENFVPKIEEFLEKRGNTAPDEISENGEFPRKAGNGSLGEFPRNGEIPGKSGNDAQDDIDSDQVFDQKPCCASSVSLKDNLASAVEDSLEKSGHSARSSGELQRNSQIKLAPVSCHANRAIPQNKGLSGRFGNTVPDTVKIEQSDNHQVGNAEFGNTALDVTDHQLSAPDNLVPKNEELLRKSGNTELEMTDHQPSAPDSFVPRNKEFSVKFGNIALDRVKTEQLDNDQLSTPDTHVENFVPGNEDFLASFGNTALDRIKIEQFDNDLYKSHADLDSRVVPESGDFGSKTGNAAPVQTRLLDGIQSPKSGAVVENYKLFEKSGNAASVKTGLLGNTALERIKIEQFDNDQSTPPANLENCVVPETGDFLSKTGNAASVKTRLLDEIQSPKTGVVVENDEFFGKSGNTASVKTRLLDQVGKSPKMSNKAILLVDGDSDCQSVVKCGAQGQITIIFLPRKKSRAEKPLQEILDYLTHACRLAQLHFVLESQEKRFLLTGKTSKLKMVQCLDEIGFSHVLSWITQAWDEIDTCQIWQSWSKVLCGNFQSTDASKTSGNSLDVDRQVIYDLVGQVKGCENVTRNDIDTWLSNYDDSVICSADEEESSVEFVGVKIEPDSGNFRREFDDQDVTSEVGCTYEVITHSNVLRSLERALCYVRHQPGVTQAEVEVLQKWRDYAAEMSGRNQ